MGAYEITHVIIHESMAEARPTSIENWFRHLTHLQKIVGIEYLNTSQVTDLSYAFSNCPELQTFDLSHFDTSNVTNMERMLSGCKSLQNLKLSSL